MGFVKKTWKNRKTEYPNRRLLTKENGDTELVTVSREEGLISEEGDTFSEETMNDFEERVNDAVEEIYSALPFKIVIDDAAKTINFIDR